MDRIAVGIVGGRRSRNGLGPFLARFCEQAGAQVTGVAGPGPERAAAAAAELGDRLGHPVQAFAEPGALCRSGIEALVIASPAPHHLPALEAALASRLPTLCEKPLVTPGQRQRGLEVVRAFSDAGLLLVENCQWPYALPALWQLFPGLREQPVAELAMGLSPAAPGRALVEDSLSHFLSVLQELVPVGPQTAIDSVRFSPHGPETASTTLEVAFREPFPAVHGRLELRVVPRQPRPAWLAVNGCRMDRRILDPDYRIAFCHGDRLIAVDDPLATLVYGFVRSIREPPVERVRTTTAAIAERLRLYCGILDCWDRPAG